MTLTNEYLKKHHEIREVSGYKMKELAPEMKLVDGFTMSVQASASHYCCPRVDVEPYVSVEICFPSEEEPLIMEYAEDSVCAYVPVEVVDAVIEKHGGIV